MGRRAKKPTGKLAQLDQRGRWRTPRPDPDKPGGRRYFSLEKFGKEHFSDPTFQARYPKMKQTEADKLAHLLHNTVAAEPGRLKRGQTPTLAAVVESFLTLKRTEVDAQSVENYERATRYLMASVSGKTRLDRITRVDAERFKVALVDGDLDKCLDEEHRKAGPKSPRTVQNIIREAGAVFVYAIKHEWITKNPFRGLRDTRQAERDQPKPIELGTAKKIIEAVLARERTSRPIRPGSNEAWAAAIALARFGGLRSSEIRDLKLVNLQFDDPNPKLRRILVRNKKTFGRVRGREEYRRVPVGPYFESIIRKATDGRPEGCEYVIDRRCIGSRHTMNDYGWMMKLAGIAYIPAFWQNCRRSCTQDLSKKVPMKAHCDILGHTEQVAMRYYLHTDAETLAVAAAALEPPADAESDGPKLQLVG